MRCVADDPVTWPTISNRGDSSEAEVTECAPGWLSLLCRLPKEQVLTTYAW